jgi:AcrR family transcriptional regulator
LAVFEATERLLARRSLHELSVAEILRESKVSRAGFYYYFSSKHDVVATLVARVFEDIFTSIEPWIGEHDEPSKDVLRRSLETGVGVWVDHGPLLAATIENMHAVPELRAVWLRFVDRFTEAIANEIRHERQTGTAPRGTSAEVLAGTLVWASERLLYLGLRGFDPSVPTIEVAGEALLELWFASIYGPAATPAREP